MIQLAKWIACPRGMSGPVVEKTFTVKNPVGGKIEITGLGYFVLFLNGQRVSKAHFLPAVSDYEPRDTSKFGYPLYDQTTHRVYFLQYELGEYLRDGENKLEIYLGNGWYTQHWRIAEGDIGFSDCLKTVFAAEIISADGTKTMVCSDGSEVCRQTWRVFDNLYLGEVLDARLKNTVQPAQKVTLCPPVPATLTLQTCPGDTVRKVFAPQKLSVQNGHAVYDVGENISGWASVTAGGKAGEKITLRFAEELDAQGEPDFASTGGNHTFFGRQQIQQDVYILSGAESEEFCPEFVFHGFRYIEVTGEIQSITVEEVNAAVPVSSGFTSSDAALNWLYDAFMRTQRSNMHGGIPSDCPHRERLGYTGDGQAVCETALLCYDALPFYEKWLQDILDCQGENGHIQHTAPLMGGGGGPGGWGCAIAIVPWAMYRYSGKRMYLEKTYPAVKKWLGYLVAHCENGLVTHEEEGGWCLGDWAMMDPVEIPVAYVNTCYLAKTQQIASQMAALLGFGRESAQLLEELQATREAIRAAYYDEQTGSFCNGVQGADAFALFAGAQKDDRTLRNLAARYESLGYFDTGFLATEFLPQQLIQNGYADIALELLTGERMGTFRYMMEQGATTLWEYLNAKASHSHPMFGAVTRHLFDGFLGITQRPGTVGYRNIVIAPHLPQKLSHADGFVCVPAGKIRVAFRKENGQITFTVEIPPCESAKLSFAGQSISLHEGENTACFAL